MIVSTRLSLTGTVDFDGVQGGALCLQAFCRIPYVGEGLLVFSMITFAFSTVLGWSVVGEKCISFVLGERVCKIYRILWVGAVLISPLCTLNGVWALGDFVNALLVIPNVTGLLLLSKQVKKDTLDYFQNT